MSSPIVVYVDGACEPINPRGIATFGFVIIGGSGSNMKRDCDVVEGEEASNNVAEYTALIAALRWLLDNGMVDVPVVVKSDSQLLANQMNGFYEVRAPRLIEVHRQATDIALQFEGLKIVWIPREENRIADALSKDAYRRYMAEHPEVAESYSRYFATQKQREFLTSLGVELPPFTSKQEASNIISSKLSEKRGGSS